MDPPAHTEARRERHSDRRSDTLVNDWSNAARWVVVATDQRCAPCARETRDYLPHRWRPDFDALLRLGALNRATIGPPSATVQDQIRMQTMDRAGIAAEILSIDAEPVDWGRSTAGPTEHGLLEALRQAQNRWLADFCAARPTRRVGVARVTLDNPTGTADEIRSMARSGLRAIAIACDTPYDLETIGCNPVWRACVEADMPVKLESGVAALRGMARGGAFERFPQLRVVISATNLRTAGDALWRMDSEPVRARARGMKFRTTGGTFSSNCTVELPCIVHGPDKHLRRVAAHCIAWGGTTHHGDARRTLQRHVQFATRDSELRLRMFFGANAAETYRLSLRALALVARSIGPAVSDMRLTKR